MEDSLCNLLRLRMIYDNDGRTVRLVPFPFEKAVKYGVNGIRTYQISLNNNKLEEISRRKQK